MSHHTISSQTTSLRNKVFLIVLIPSLVLLGVWLKHKLDESIRERENAALTQTLSTYSSPIIEAINKYQKDYGEYPRDLQALIPDYLSQEPYAIVGNRLTYIPEPYYGVPYYFGFSGNYSGLAFMHGWHVIYCPLSICEIQDVKNDGAYRLDENWIFVHSSAL